MGQIPKSCLQANSTIRDVRDLMWLRADFRESLLQSVIYYERIIRRRESIQQVKFSSPDACQMRSLRAHNMRIKPRAYR